MTLTTPLRGGEFVRGHVLAVATIGLPLVVVATAVTGALSPLGPPTWVSLAVVSGILCLLGPVVALAIGTAFPRFGTARVTRGRSAVIPSKTAFAGYTVVVAVGFLAGGVALIPGGANLLGILIRLGTTLLGSPLDIGASTIRVGGAGVALVFAVVVPLLAYRYIVGRFETYTLESTTPPYRSG